MKHNYIIFFFLLTSLMLVKLVYPQSLVTSHTIKWGGEVTVAGGDSVVRMISFEGASFDNNSSLPVWEEIFLGNYSDSVSLFNCKYAPITDGESALIKKFSAAISTKESITIKQFTSKRNQGVSIRFIPLITDAGGAIQKLVSFELLLIPSTVSSTYKSVKSYATESVLSSGDWYKLSVTETGVYAIGYSDLVSMGINPAEINPAKIGIFGRGGTMLPEENSASREDDVPENAIEVIGQADGSFDQGDMILFYAQGPVSWDFNPARQMWEHTSHLYADTISYLLTTNRGTGKRIQNQPSVTASATDQVDAFDFYATSDDHKFNLIKSGRQWFSQIFDVITTRNIPFNVPQLASGGEISIHTVTAAKSINASSFQFTIGGQSWTSTHTAISTYTNSPVASGSYSYKSLKSISLPISVDVLYNKTSSSAAGYLDYIDLNARCSLIFSGDQLAFRDSRSVGEDRVAQYTIKNVTGKVKVWDVTNHMESIAVASNSSGNDFIFKADAEVIRQFVAFDESKLLKAKFIGKLPNQNLHALSGTDMIILAPQIFMSEATRLGTFHSSTSDLNVVVLDPVTVYNEFASGTPDITAIRDFMKMLYDRADVNALPRYLLLFGDASYDYKDVLPANTNFIPSWQSVESYSPISSLVSDDYFGTLDDNEGSSYADFVDIGIGRLPVRTLKEATEAVDKILLYSIPSADNEGDWRNIITFVADDEDLNDHIDQSEQMAKSIEYSHPELNIDKIYLDSYVQVAAPGGNRYPDVNKAISQRVEKGSLILNYTGHGGETGWAHEEVLKVNEITNWANRNALPVFVTATCEFSRYDDPGRPSAGEYVLTNPTGGSIALFTTTRPTYGTPNFELNKKFYQYALSNPETGRLRMGDIIMNSKRDKGANENGRKYVLLGDPALRIAFPELNVVTTKVNGVQVGNGQDTLRALMEVTFEGMITDRLGNPVEDFTGTVYPSVFDKEVTQKTLANDGGSVYTFSMRKNLLYKGKVNVTNGYFSFTFIVPKDIAYRFDTGKISYYATDGTRDATGSYTDLVVGGASDENVTDNSGPSISLYINDLRFRDGGITDPNARLLAVISDESGINTIGNGIGHDITAVLDGNTSEPYILNEFYESDINTFKSGYIWFPFSLLDAGEHTVTVKVWDILNNSSETSLRFLVLPSGEFVINRTYNFPNPFSDYTDIIFEHNQQNVDFAIRAEIYSLTGQQVRVIESTATQSGSVSTPLRWDGLSQQGASMPSGIYVYNLTVRSSNGLFARTSGKLIFQK